MFLAHSASRHEAGEKWCALAMRLLHHLSTFKCNYQEKVSSTLCWLQGDKSLSSYSLFLCVLHCFLVRFRPFDSSYKVCDREQVLGCLKNSVIRVNPRGLVQVKGSRVTAAPAHPYPEIPKVPPTGGGGGNSCHEPSKAVYHLVNIHFIVSLDDQGIRWSSGSYGKQHIQAPSWRVTWTDRLIRQQKIHSFWEKHSYSYTWRLCICIRHGLALIEFCSKEIIRFILLASSFL